MLSAPVNAHTHLYSGLAPLGMPAPEVAPENFVEILERVWWRLDRALDHDSLRASARFYVAEALRLGTVGLVDHHESPNFIRGSLDVIADACQELGMPAVLCYGATERNGGVEEARAGLAECQRFIEDNTRPLVRGVVGLHAAFTVSDEILVEAAELARRLGTVLHVHVAEDRADVDDAVERGYSGVIDRLAKNGGLVPGSIFAHGVHLNRDEVTSVRDAECWLVQNPRSNLGNQVGYPTWLAASDRVALGTDGYPAEMSVELAALREHSAAAGESAEVVERRLPASAVLLAERFGGAAPRAPITVDLANGHVVREGTGPLDMGAIRAEAERQAATLWQRMKAL